MPIFVREKKNLVAYLRNTRGFFFRSRISIHRAAPKTYKSSGSIYIRRLIPLLTHVSHFSLEEP